MAYKKPLPKPNADTRPFWEGCREHQLRFQRCGHCGHVRWPPSVICPACHVSETEWIVASGKGRVYSFAVYHVAFHSAFKDDVPYVTAAVELAEGPRILTNIVGCSPSEVKCDMPVQVVWDDVTDEFSLPKFKPAAHPD
jgi:uncharacterized OB-fold protein